MEQKANRIELALKTEKKRQSLYQKELAWMRTGAKARSTKQKGRINRFNELKSQIGHLQEDQDLEIALGSQRLGKDIIEFKNANLAFDQLTILQDFNWLVQANDRIGISGENGAGKTTLFKVIMGQLPLDSGVLKIGETVKLGYYSQQTEPIPEDKRVIEYLSEVAESVVDRNGQRIEVTGLLERFLFPRFMHGTLIRKLSGGEKRRLFLLKILMQQPNVLLLDEPTNDLDIGTLAVLEDYLDSFAGTVITISHDRYFLDRVAEQLLIFKGQEKIERYVGRFTDYLNQSAESSSKPTDQSRVNPAPQTTPKATKDKTKLTYGERLEWDQLNEDIDQLTDQQQALELAMSENGDNYEKLARLQQELNEVVKTLDEKTARWEYLSEFVDE